MHRVYNCERCPCKDENCKYGCSNYVLKPIYSKK